MRLPHFLYYLQAFYAFLFSQKYQCILGTFHKKKCVFAFSQSIFLGNTILGKKQAARPETQNCLTGRAAIRFTLCT